MRKILLPLCLVLFLAPALAAQGKRLWVLRAPGEMAEYDSQTFAPKEKVKVPPETAKSPQSLSVNHLGQMLFVPPVLLPLSESDMESPHKVKYGSGTERPYLPLIRT